MSNKSRWGDFLSTLSARLTPWRATAQRGSTGDFIISGRSGTTEDLYRGHRAALVSWWGTVLYFDEEMQELRHGRFEHHPVNVILLPCGTQGEESDRAVLACLAGGHVQLASCTAKRSVAGRLTGEKEDENDPGFTTFAFVVIDQDRIGLKSGGMFLCAEQDGRITLSKSLLRDWESFVVAVPGSAHPLRAVALPPLVSLALAAGRDAGRAGGLLIALRRRTGASAVVLCNLDWLRTYIASEHFHLIRLLHEAHGFDILNTPEANFENRSLLRRLNTYDVVLVAYSHGARIPMNRLAGYRIYRIDDLEAYNAEATQSIRRLTQNADMLISPYAYDLPKFFPHPNIRWVPYSSAVEEEAGPPSFNDEPIAKVLLSGSVAWDRPFREYVFGLEDDRLVKLGHPGYHGRYDVRSPETVKRRWYEEIRSYLCAFCDAHSLRYIHLRVFEIASMGSLLLADRLVEREMNVLGFVEGETCLFSDRDDFLERVAWVLDPTNRAAVDRIRRAGMALALRRHTTRQRAMELAAMVDEVAMTGRT
jgi:hypothetical protein